MKGKKIGRILRIAVLELLCAAILLLSFAYFHHARKWLQQRNAPAVPVVTAAPVPTPVPTAAPEPVVGEAVPEETPVPAELTEWQQRFAEFFTDEVELTDSSYTSPEVSVQITSHTFKEGPGQSVYYVADIHVARLENFFTLFANDKFEYFSTQDAGDMVKNHNVLLAVDGDFCTYQNGGVLVRNGEVFRQDYSYYDLLVLYNDGSMETLRPNTYQLDEVLVRGVWQIWQFGPALFREDGSVNPGYFNTTSTVQQPNPRCAVGYYEPGHYCFLVADGRQDGYSYGLRLEELSQIMFDMGCRDAYNLDGGGSALMYFNGGMVNHQSNGGDREIGDLLCISETEAPER